MICDVGVGVCSRSLDGNSTGENPVTETQLKETCRTLTPRRMGGGGPRGRADTLPAAFHFAPVAGILSASKTHLGLVLPSGPHPHLCCLLVQ